MPGMIPFSIKIYSAHSGLLLLIFCGGSVAQNKLFADTVPSLKNSRVLIAILYALHHSYIIFLPFRFY